jgi:preprotein translocase subunit SecA
MGSIPDQVKTEAFKYVVLNTLDLRWKEHLRNIDALQEGIGLRGYAQKNPIVEYKLEAYDLFIEMRAAFKLEALSLLSRLTIKANVEQELPPADEPARPTATFPRPRTGNTVSSTACRRASRCSSNRLPAPRPLRLSAAA